jgi:hypothetical protein
VGGDSSEIGTAPFDAVIGSYWLILSFAISNRAPPQSSFLPLLQVNMLGSRAASGRAVHELGHTLNLHLSLS